MKKKYTKKLEVFYNPDLCKLDKKFKKKRYFLPKLFLGIIALRFGTEIVINNTTKQPTLPHNDTQKLPDDFNQSVNAEYVLAKQSYNNLINILTEKANFYNINLTDYELYNIAYDNVSNKTLFIFTNNLNAVTLEFDFSEEDIKNCILENSTLCDRISSLYVLVKSSTLSTIPTINFLSDELKIFYFENFENFDVKFISEPTISIGDERKTDPQDFVTGRDYVYYKVYGTTKTENGDYFSTITVAITKDNYDILEIKNLQDYYINNGENPRLIINQTSQYDDNVLKELNKQINTIKNTNNKIPLKNKKYYIDFDF